MRSIFIIGLVGSILFSLNLYAQNSSIIHTGSRNTSSNICSYVEGATPCEGMILTPQDIADLKSLPDLEIPQKYQNRILPDEVDNSKSQYFPTILHQGSTMACSQCAICGYMYSYEFNSLYKIKPTKTNGRAPGFTWHFLNDGKNTGSRPAAGIKILQKIGAPSIEDFGGMFGSTCKNTEWMDGYEKYHNANKAFFGELLKIEVTTNEGIEKLKQWFYDHANGDTFGGLVAFASNTNFTVSKIATGPHKGEAIVTKVPEGKAHCMTLAGYSDLISYDLNGDGRITNDIDITRDGVVNLEDRETGAVQLVNSYGTGFQNNGTVWVTYSALKNGVPYAWASKLHKHIPKLECKIKITHSIRGNIKISTGFSNQIEATTPTEKKDYADAFNHTGGQHPMFGKGGKSTIEIGLDVTDFYNKMNRNEGKIFLQVDAKNASGTINSFSLMDYSSEPPREIQCKQSNVPLKSGTNYLSIVYQQTTNTITMKSSIPNKRFEIMNSFRGTSLYVPFAIRSQVTITNLKGRTITNFYTDREDWYTIKELNNTGIYIISIKSTNGTFISQAYTVRFTERR